MRNRRKKGLTQSRLRELLTYDPATGVFSNRIKRHYKTAVGEAAGFVSRSGDGSKYLCVSLDGKTYKLHRLAFLYMQGFFPELPVDHIDGDGLNNAWRNLRQVTSQDNSKNAKLRADSTSGCTGVYWHKASGKWNAYIYVDGKRVSLGYFADRDDAARARKVAQKFHGFHENHGVERCFP